MSDKNTIIFIFLILFVLLNSINCKKEEYFTAGSCKKCADEKNIKDPCSNNGNKCIGKYKGCNDEIWDKDFDYCYDIDVSDDDKKDVKVEVKSDDTYILNKFPNKVTVNSCINCMQSHLSKRQKVKLCSFVDPKKATNYLLKKCKNYCTEDGDISIFNDNIKIISPLKTKICLDLKKK